MKVVTPGRGEMLPRDDEARGMSEIPILYSQPDCHGCEATREFFADHCITYEERNITLDSTAHEEFLQLGYPSTPVIVVDGRKILGFQRKALEEALGLDVAPTGTAEITVYRYTGRHFGFSIPGRWCEECDLSITVARRVAESCPGAEIRVRSWFFWGWKPLLRGGWHPPIVTVNDRIFSAGTVPNRAELTQAVREALGHPPQ